MITTTKAFQTSDGLTHATIQHAQQHEIELLADGKEISSEYAAATANFIVTNAEKIIDILTTTEKSRPKARAVNGGRKPRKAKTDAPSAPTTTQIQ